MADSLMYYGVLGLKHAPINFIESIPGLANFLRLQRFFHSNAGIVDRTGTLSIPFKTNLNPMPKMHRDFNLSYEDCIMARMAELDALHQATGKRFRVFYSGGIDSTTMLAGFIQYYGLTKSSELLDIYCTIDSIYENPWAWDRYIAAGNFTVKHVNDYRNIWDDPIITLMGEGNDQLFGGLGSGPWGKYTKDLYAPVDQELLAKFLSWCNNTNDLTDSTYAAEKFIQIAHAAEFPIDNMYLLTWWCRFVLMWDSCMPRVLVQANRSNFPSTFLQDSFLQFFNTPQLQQWSLKFHKDNPDRFAEAKYYKQIGKDMILKILDIPEYADKTKFGSWPRVHSLMPTGLMIDSDLVIHKNTKDYIQFVNANNSFI